MKHDDLERLEPQNCHEYDTPRGPVSVVTQAGVQRAEAVAMTWTKQSLYAAYAGFAIDLLFSGSYILRYSFETDKKTCRIFLMAFCTSLDIQVTSLLAYNATSAFSSHSLLATVGVIGSVLNGIKSNPSIQASKILWGSNANV